ncbi:unnamed protein product [Calypogeia fissa]
MASPASAYRAAGNGHSREQVVPDSLLSDLRKMLNNPEFSDVTFLCKDKVTVHACSMLLAARSPRFKSILLRKKKAEYPTEFSSSTIISIFGFLYTEKLIEERARSCMEGIELIHAAYHFQLENLAGLAQQFMPRQGLYSWYGWDHGNSYSVQVDGLVKTPNCKEVQFARFHVPIGPSDIPIVYEWDIIVEQLCAGFCEIGLQVVDDVHDKTTFIGKLSQQPKALALCHDSTYIMGIWNPTEGRKEYNQKVHIESGDRIRVQLDMSKRTCSFFVKGASFRGASSNLPDGVYFPAVCLGSGTKGKVHIELVKGFGRGLYSWYSWEHENSYSVQVNGIAIQKSDKVVQFARFHVPIGPSDIGVYEWDIIIEELCEGFCEIGLQVVENLRDRTTFIGKLSQQPKALALHHDSKKSMRILTGPTEKPSNEHKKMEIKADDRIRFQLDMSTRTCSYSVKGARFLLGNLPDGVYFPAVCLGEGTQGRVRIELVSGFEPVH